MKTKSDGNDSAKGSSDKLPWSFFSTRLSEASNSLIGYENLSSTAADGFASRPTRCRSSMRS
jgi:hypothetical protein